ncbi:M15 family metallopeptidase [Cellulomonas sp. Y8]|uniref:M15 family metallopeptidase n=1 Tax=Cellulomonas sp. Y8 TaxID=2591145 RepID=UPI001FED8719|nr:M15 family metallopeptidase [Cellulomonas sp. Y8]
MDADLAARFRAAQGAADAEGVELRVTSGKRTPEEQQRLVDDAVATHGVPEAYRWVLPPESSAHVQGLAVDVGPTEGAYWLAEHGVDFGLCQTYANEVWHFEKLPDGADACPEQHPDSSWGW